MLIYREHPVPASLAQWAIGYWSFDATDLPESVYEHHVPPDGCISILGCRAGTEVPVRWLIVGPRVDPLVVPVHRGQHYDGIRLWPHTAGTLQTLAVCPLRDAAGPLETVLPDWSNALSETFANRSEKESLFTSISEVFESKLSGHGAPDPLIGESVAAIVGDPQTIDLDDQAKKLGLSRRQFQRRFAEATGITAKQFQRIRRFRDSVAELLRDKPRPWVEVAYENGFSDQAHLANQFRQLVGLTAEQLRRTHESIRHENVRP